MFRLPVFAMPTWQPHWRAALARLRDYPKRILGYSVKLYLLELAFAVTVSYPAIRLEEWLAHSATPASWKGAAQFALTQGQALVSLPILVWIMTPIAIRLLRIPGAERPSTEEKKLGRYFAILAGIGAIALEIALFPPLFRLVSLRGFPDLVYDWIISLVLSSPFLLGNIGWALIAAGESSLSLNWPELFHAFSPLRFDEREDH
jgi:hypothetical protein